MDGKVQKIVILGTAYPYRGGLAAYNERLAREFAARGADVSILTFTVQYPSWLFPGKTQYSTGQPPEDLRIERCVNSVNPFNWLKVARRIRRMAPDMVIVKYWLPYMAPCLGTIARACRRRGSSTRVISVLDNMIPHEHRPGDKLLSRYFCGSVDGLVAMSRSVLEDVDIFDTHKPRLLCPHPIYDNFGSPVSREEACRHLGLDTGSRYLLFFGLIREYKGLDWLLEALGDKTLAGRDDFRLIVAGEFYGDPRRYYELGKPLGDRVIWRTGFVPDGEVRYYFCAADLIVQPYKTATQSGVTQIAYHFEKPMLVTDTGGLAEIVPDGRAGYVVAPRAGEIAGAISRFLDSGQDFAEGISQIKKQYSWAAMCDTLETIYTQCYDNKK